MPGRVGVVAVVFVAGLYAAVVASRGSADTTPTTTLATTAAPTVSTPSTTAAPPPATTSAGAATTTATTRATTPTTTTPTTKTTNATPARRVVAPHRPRHPRRRLCAVVGAVEIVSPQQRLLRFRPYTTQIARRVVHAQRLAYPRTGSVVAMGSLTLHAGRCSAAVAIRSLSLFGGAVSAGSVALTTRVAAGTRTSVRGVRVNGRPVAGNPRSIRIGHWGFLTLHPPRAALAIRLVKPHAGFSGGTVIVIAFAARSEARPVRTLTLQHAARSSVFGRHRRHPRAQAHRPLHVTPPLGVGDYVFPVAGSPSFGDSYGGFRADVAGNWHHGDDIFAPIGTPALAVADGTLNRVGWERIGGWRLWVRDRLGNEFYYAHLSGYAPDALRSKRVRAGEVLGFVGNTGDAFTTPPHLHFEIHPHQLLRLQYDGAVDPTSYLEQWRHVRDVDAPRPAVPELPAGDVGREARFVFRTLLAARGLVRRAPTSPPRVAIAGVDRPSRPAVAAAPRPAAKDAAPARIAVAPLAVVAALAACGLAAFFGRRRPRRT